MTIISLLVFFTVIQLCFHVFMFSRVYRTLSVGESVRDTPFVSIIMAARNEEQNLKQFLPKILAQDYPDFEVIVVNDRSTDGSGAYLKFCSEKDSKLKIISITDVLENVNPKKRALEEANTLAKGKFLLCTDADCEPLSTAWIKTMVSELSNNFQIVLGFSPYKKELSFLNRFIEFETLYTAIQYFSFAKIGKPYMSVGRNFLYEKALFSECGGFDGIRHMNGGDDDLLLAKMSTGSNTTVCMSPTSFVESVPKSTWRDYILQKHRHLSVGSSYSYQHKTRLGMLSTSHIFFYAFIFISFVFNYFVVLAGCLFALRSVVVFSTFYKSGKKLKVNYLNPFEVLLLDFLYAAGYMILGIVSLFYRSSVWK